MKKIYMNLKTLDKIIYSAFKIILKKFFSNFHLHEFL